MVILKITMISCSNQLKTSQLIQPLIRIICKNQSLSHFLIICLFLCPFQDNNVVEWLTPVEHDFGDLKQGVPATIEFRFKNISSEPMTIDNVRSTCGCTAPDWEESPILPGEEGVIKIEYDAKKLGFFYKKINVYFSNQRKSEKLSIEGFVE